MKAYPSIPTKIDFSKPYHIFNKLDGSNIRAEWGKKSGFSKFGSRTQLLTQDQTKLFPSIHAFLDKYADALQPRLEKAKVERALVFFEWVGPNSFAGSHPDEISEMSPVIIDIAFYKKGIIPPEQFIDFMGELDYPALLHKGKIDEDFFQSIRNSTLPGMSLEGVIGKGAFSQKEGGPTMFKIKSNAWLTKLKEICNGDEILYQKLK